MINRLKEIRSQRGLTLQKVADAVGATAGQIRFLETGARKISLIWLEKLSQFYNVDPSEILAAPPPIPVVGRVGATDSETPKVYYFDDHAPDPEETAPHIAGAKYKSDEERTVAVEIVGYSIGRLFNGWFAYYNAPPRDPTADMLGQLCVVWTESGEAYIKELHKGQNGTFNLKSADGTLLLNQRLQGACLVIGIAKRKS